MAASGGNFNAGVASAEQIIPDQLAGAHRNSVSGLLQCRAAFGIGLPGGGPRVADLSDAGVAQG